MKGLIVLKPRFLGRWGNNPWGGPPGLPAKNGQGRRPGVDLCGLGPFMGDICLVPPPGPDRWYASWAENQVAWPARSLIAGEPGKLTASEPD
jgi:hypothetical protein